MNYRSTSFWFDAIGAEPEPRSSLPGDLDVDVVILGAGFSGLWTAYYLAIADPSCRIAVIERDIAGFGASGRNGGWCWPAVEGLEQLHEKDPEGGDRLREAIISVRSQVSARNRTLHSDLPVGKSIDEGWRIGRGRAGDV